MSIRFFWIILLFLTGSPAVIGQLFPKRHFTPQDGLTQKNVTTLFEDSGGSLWIGTKNGGVSQFDGHNMVSWTVNDSLESNVIRAFTEDRKGGILIFSNTGVTRFHLGKMKILLKNHFFQTNYAINDTSGYSYFLVKADQAELWMYEPSGKISVLPFAGNGTCYPERLWKNPVTGGAFLKDSDGHYSELSAGKFIPADDAGKYPWFGFPDVYDEQLMNRYSRLFINSSQSGFLPFDQPGAKCVFQPAAGWFFTDPGNNDLLLLKNQNRTDTVNYPFHFINCLLVDHRMQVWIGTENGLVVFHHLLFRNYINHDILPDPWTFAEGKEDDMFVGNYGAELAIISGNRIMRARLAVNLPATKENLHSFTHFYHGGVRGFSGEYYLNTSRGALTLNHESLSRTVPLPPVPVYSSLSDAKRSRVLFSTFRKGIFSWTNDHRLMPLIRTREPAMDRIYSMAFDSADRLFLGSEYKVAVAKDSTFQNFRDEQGDSIPGAYTICRDRQGNMWFGNDYGLYVYDGRRITHVHHEFLNQSIRASKIINGNQLLVGTSHGIGVLFLDTWKADSVEHLKWYDFRSGYETGEVNINGFYEDTKGKIWIAGSSGVCRMDPGWVRFDTIPLYAKIQTLLAGSSQTGWREVPPDSDGSYHLAPGNNQIRITFNSINTKTPERDYYSFRLVGLDNQWSFPSQEMFTTFNNLEPGSYRFELKAMNGDGLWAPAPVSVQIILVPAWYQTHIFMTAMAILAVILIVVSTIHISRKVQLLRNRRIRREQELAEMNLAAIQSQLEPHFVFNVLNSIGYAIRANETDMAYDYLTKFSSLIRKWLKSAGNAMVTLESELNLVQEYLDLEKFRFEEKLDFEIKVEKGVPMDFRVPTMILQIPAENAVKHGLSGLTGKGLLIIRISPEVGGIRILVRDNGIGRTAAMNKTSAGNQKGLKLMEKLLKHIRQFEHCEVSHQVTDLFDKRGNAAGTEVTILIRHS